MPSMPSDAGEIHGDAQRGRMQWTPKVLDQAVLNWDPKIFFWLAQQQQHFAIFTPSSQVCQNVAVQNLQKIWKIRHLKSLLLNRPIISPRLVIGLQK